MQFEVLNRWTGKRRFLAEIDCAEDAPRAIKLGLAVRWARKSGAVLSGADLSGADLSDANLRRAVLSDAVLSGADLRRAVLSGADLEIPIIPHIDAAILASIEANKATGKNGLEMGRWHGGGCDETNWCNTTHCRAGYAICLAGKDGFALEAKVGSAAAGALIYAKSRPNKPVPDFYCDNERAMADIVACAAEDSLPA
jgi:hypothetical protein